MGSFWRIKFSAADRGYFITSITFLTVAFITPLTYTAYLGQPAVRFHCSVANADGVAWFIDGDIRQADELLSRGIGIEINRTLLESNLTITSSTENNNTRIRCLAHYIVSDVIRYIQSDEVIFRVQGQLANLIDT